MNKIVVYKNNYYLQIYGITYGPYHSIAEAELNRVNPAKSEAVQEPLSDSKFIKNLY